jgi:hypothetical protein
MSNLYLLSNTWRKTETITSKLKNKIGLFTLPSLTQYSDGLLRAMKPEKEINAKQMETKYKHSYLQVM